MPNISISQYSILFKYQLSTGATVLNSFAKPMTPQATQLPELPLIADSAFFERPKSS